MAESVKINKFVEKPSDFDGTDFDSFLRQVSLYLVANRNAITIDEDKIIFVLSFMKKGLAGQWAENFYGRILESTTQDFGTYTDFLAALKRQFEDPNKARNAQHKLATTRQGSTETAEAFFQRFELNRRAAGYIDGHDHYLIQVLEMNLKRDIVKSIYTQELPEDYEGWKRRAVQIDQQYRRWNSMFPASNERRQWTPKPSGQEARHEAPRPSGGRTFPGMGEPMDIDRRRAQGLCFNCGEKGHMARNCPKPRAQRTRQVAAEEEACQKTEEKSPSIEMTKEQKEKKAEELRAQLRALGF